MKTYQQHVETLANTIRATRANGDITSNGSGTTIVGDGIALYRFLALRSGLSLEVKCPGMRVTRGPKCSTRAKAEFGFKGGPAKVLAQLDALYAAAQMLAEANDAPEICGCGRGWATHTVASHK